MSIDLKAKKSKQRCEKILEVASRLFLDNGYEATTLNDIIKISGGSLSTIYKFFENKDKLFATIVKVGAENFRENISKKTVIKISDDLVADLTNFSNAYLKFFFSQENLKFHKLLVSAGFQKHTLDDLKELYRDVIMGPGENLTSLLKFHFPNKNDESIQRLGMFFCFILREPYFHRAIFFSDEYSGDCDEMSSHIEKCINLFLNGTLNTKF